MDNNTINKKDYWAKRLRLEELLCKAEECLLLTNMIKASYDEMEEEVDEDAE